MVAQPSDMGQFSPIKVNLTEYLLLDIAENPACFLIDILKSCRQFAADAVESEKA